MALLIPARDEEESLPGLLAELRGADPGPGVRLSEIIVVDNGSTDRTGKIAVAAGATWVREPRVGYGRACQRGIAELRRRPVPPDVLVFLDADDLLAPGQIGSLVGPIHAGRADLVIGERYHPRGEGVRSHAALGNRWISWVLKGMYASPTRDMGPFRAIRWDCLRELALDDPTYGWYVQMQVRALRLGYRVEGIPVAFRRRTLGQSKVSGSLKASAAAGYVMLRTLAVETIRSQPFSDLREGR